MKKQNRASILGLLLLTSFAIAVPAWAQQMSGIMMVVKGDIKVTSKDGKTEAGKVGRKVGSGDMITSGADSRAKIVMSDKNVINVSPDSKIMIEKYENDGKDKKNVELNVLYGKVRASVEQKYDGDKSKFNIKTPSAVAGVRGTDFMAGFNRDTKVTQIITFTGTVAVGQPGPGGTITNPVFVQPGQMTQVGSGQAAEAPKPVPKEELNKANTETKAETAPAPSASNDKQPAPESGKESGKEPAKDQASVEPAKENRGPAAVAEDSGSANTSPSAMAPPLPGAPGSAPPIVSPVGPMIPRLPSSITPIQNSFLNEAISNRKVQLNITIITPQ